MKANEARCKAKTRSAVNPHKTFYVVDHLSNAKFKIKTSVNEDDDILSQWENGKETFFRYA